MKIVRVQYTTRAEFAARNRENIAAVAAEVTTLGLPGTVYSCYLLPDGKTFMHLDTFESEEAHERLQELASFKKFAEELHASGLRQNRCWYCRNWWLSEVKGKRRTVKGGLREHISIPVLTASRRRRVAWKRPCARQCRNNAGSSARDPAETCDHQHCPLQHQQLIPAAARPSPTGSASSPAKKNAFGYFWRQQK